MDISRVRKRLKEIKSSDGDKKEKRLEEVTEAQRSGVRESRIEDVDIPRVEEKTGEVTGEERTGEWQETVKEIELISFRISSEEYAVGLHEMQEIINYRQLTPVPRSPVYLKGVTFLRGKVLPVIDLKERLEIRGNGDEARKILVLATSKDEPIGAIVGSFIRVLRFPESEILQPPPTLSERQRRFIRGVVRIGERFISVLNIEELVKMEVI